MYGQDRDTVRVAKVDFRNGAVEGMNAVTRLGVYDACHGPLFGMPQAGET